MSLTPQQRAQVLYLYHVDAVSLVIIALMTELSVSAVRRVVHEPHPKDLPRCIRYDNLLVSKTAAPSTPPPGRRYRKGAAS